MGDDFPVGMVHLFRWEGLAMATDVEWVRSRFAAFSVCSPYEASLFRLETVAKARRWILEGVSQ